MDMIKILKLIFSIAVSLGAGIIGSIFTAGSVDTWYPELTLPWFALVKFTPPKILIVSWYAELTLPWFAPPGWLISIIWTILYILMGISLYIILTKDLTQKKVKIAVGAFVIQLLINGLWSFLFFGLESILLGLIGIVVLWFAVFFTIYRFYLISEKAAYILIPYIIWVTIALLINLSIFLIN